MQLCRIGLLQLLPSLYQGIGICYPLCWSVNLPYRRCLQELPEWPKRRLSIAFNLITFILPETRRGWPLCVYPPWEVALFTGEEEELYRLCIAGQLKPEDAHISPMSVCLLWQPARLSPYVYTWFHSSHIVTKLINSTGFEDVSDYSIT